MNRNAVIDIGTNSVKLTVADLDNDIYVVHEESRITRLGKNVDSQGRLNAESIQKTLAAVQEFVSIARNAGAEKIALAGTSALRDASNGIDLINEVRSTCALNVEIISGLREASLAFAAIVGDPGIVTDRNSALAVFDIGGGSTELVFGRAGVLIDNTSVNIGALRLTERHFFNDPPTETEFKAAATDGAAAISAFFAGKPPVSAVCGVGGTASTFAAIIHGSKDVHGCTVEAVDLEKCVKRLAGIPLSDRKNVQFLEPERADIIVAGGAILLSILSVLGAPSFKISLRGMRFGLLLEQRDAQDFTKLN